MCLCYYNGHHTHHSSIEMKSETVTSPLVFHVNLFFADAKWNLEVKKNAELLFSLLIGLFVCFVFILFVCLFFYVEACD